jgi:hypothetical protein
VFGFYHSAAPIEICVREEAALLKVLQSIPPLQGRRAHKKTWSPANPEITGQKGQSTVLQC